MRVLSLWIAALALAMPATAQEVFPLGDADVWEYGYIIDPPFSDPDTVRFEVRVAGRVTINDTAYAIARFPALPVDTLRADAEGRVWCRAGGRDVLLFDTTLPDGAVYPFHRSKDEYDEYEVTVYRPIVVDVPAGLFEDAITFGFDVPGVFDDEFSVTLAPGVGVVSGSSLYDGLGNLYTATIDGVVYTPVEAGSVASAVRAFPNPFASSVTVALPPGRWRTAEVTDALGRRVATLDVGRCGAGRCAVGWDGAGHPAGVYGVRAWGADGTASLRITLAR
ncbi:hypothetical protein [Rubrivirga sp.]|uniref:hypothetical protein n=1 Tax=Rubrivirga sp. TaxID=1885344 RepID=UPI003B5250EB